MSGPLLRALIVVATAKCVLGLTAVSVAAWQGPLLQVGADLNTLPVLVGLVATYGASGLFLPLASRGDPRSLALGAFLLVIASAFAQVLIRSGQHWPYLTAIAASCRLEPLLPFCLWRFVRDFPVRLPVGRMRLWPSRFVSLSLWVGLVGTIGSLLVDLRAIYSPAIMLLMMPAAAVLVERARLLGPADRRRVTFFVVALAAGLLPLSIDVVLRAVSPRWVAFTARAPWSYLSSIELALLLLVPFATAYSVIVDRVFDLRLMARAALQYALARVTIIVLTILPVAWAIASVFQARGQTIAELVTRQPWPLGTALFAVAVILPSRARLLETLDRQFFREHYDAERILGSLVESARSSRSGQQLAEVLATKLNDALHPRRLSILIYREEHQRFESMDGMSRSLSSTSSLSIILRSSDDPIDINPEDTGSILRRLDADTVVWLADGDFRLLVPLRGGAGVLRGLVALGEKKSELPYSAHDRFLLSAIGVTGGLCLDGHAPDRLPHGSPKVDNLADQAARECLQCGLVHPPRSLTCQCGSVLTTAHVPELLAGKFSIDRRLGAGGMGVVYRATDLGLNRPVAIKALRGVDPREGWRLRREARAMALLTHQHLATVFGLELWFSRPLLVVEYLAGGTLADRLAKKHLLREEQVAQLGIDLCDALGVLHRSGILHRDIKPANIGFTSDGVVKLLDFGLARQFSPADSTAVENADADAHRSGDPTHTPTGQLIGTPAYMSIEALRREAPDDAFDLWALAVTMFEAMVGVNPFRELSPILRSRDVGAAVDPRSYLPRCSSGSTALFAAALSPDHRARPQTAAAFASLIRQHLNPQ